MIDLTWKSENYHDLANFRSKTSIFVDWNGTENKVIKRVELGGSPGLGGQKQADMLGNWILWDNEN